ncbi:MAG: RNA methyltransferase [Saprospiraceae bacterium]
MSAKISQSQIQFIRSLHRTKYRQKLHKFIIEGDKICAERLQYRDVILEGIYATRNWLNDHRALLDDIPCFEVTTEQLAKISSLRTPNQVVGVCAIPQESLTEAHFLTSLSFYLDTIQDPGNMGTIIRTLDWFGFRTIFVSPGSVDVYNPKVVQGSMGSLFNVKLIHIELSSLIQKLNQPAFPILGTAMHGQNVFEMPFPARGLVVIGNEGQGIRPVNQPLITEYIGIPKIEKATAESLNAAVACGIIAALAARNQ